MRVLVIFETIKSRERVIVLFEDGMKRENIILRALLNTLQFENLNNFCMAVV